MTVTHITYLLSPLEYSFPERAEQNTYYLKNQEYMSDMVFFLFVFIVVLTQLWQEALIPW